MERKIYPTNFLVIKVGKRLPSNFPTFQLSNFRINVMANQDTIFFAPESQEAVGECISIQHAFAGVLEQAGLRGFANTNF